MLSPQNFWPPLNFAALPAELSAFETAQFVVIPVPYDATTSWRGGTREGPQAILDASMNMETFDRELKREICECGIHTTNFVEPVAKSPESMAVRVTEVMGEVLFADKIPVMLGGEHSLSFGGVCAALKLDLQGPLSVLQLDAHTDLRQSYGGSRFSHACVARRISELPGIQITQVGLRATSGEEHADVPANVTQFWCEDVLDDWDKAIEKIVNSLSNDVYLTFDVDVCDPSWMPDTGTPEPGGLGYYQVRDLLREVCRRKNVVAVDCVELMGGHPASAFAVARLLYKCMGYLSE
ncbi:MAG TPA: agmatinase [Abditibacteriaceae bacterium]|nr:agmatinase [Abditibacteriaceae bacterium]